MASIGKCCFIFILVAAALLGCDTKQKSTGTAEDSNAQPELTLEGIDYTAATKNMAYRISRAFESIDPQTATFLVGDKRLEIFKQQAQSQDVQTQIVAKSHYAYELLNAGKTDRAIIALEELLEEYKKYNVNPDTKLQFSRLLAIAYLRLGEQENCVNNRNHASCILPIQPEGRYKMTSGSESAMQQCLAVLKEFPDDAETQYLLNIAAMTIGKYPSGVPAQYRLPESALTSGAAFTRFTDVSHDVGIRGTGLSGGACVEDFDGDGWLDIMRSSWGENDPLVFWRNTGNGTFENATAKTGLAGITGGLNILHADVNNDGLSDVFVLRGAWMRDQGRIPNSLLLNLGGGKFADVTMEAGLLSFAPTQTAVFTDFNLDGWLDLFIGNESSHDVAFPSEFYLNNGNGTFRDITAQVNVPVNAFIKGCASGDVNNDGWPDLYISTYPGENMLLLHTGLNEQGIPQFRNIAGEAGVTEPAMSFPTWIWDYDQDGWDDIFVSTYGEGALLAAKDFFRNAQGDQMKGHPRVYHNNGNGTFTEVSEQLGLKENVYTMGCNYGDLDADGYLDFYLGTGTPEYSAVVPNKMFHNKGGKAFEDVTASGGFGHIQKGHGVAFGDLDRDGDEDIFECLGGAFAGDVYEDILFENPIGQDQHWIVLQFHGTTANRMAQGARVQLILSTPLGKRTLYRTVSTGGSFGSSSLQLEVGLGDATAIDEIAVTWPEKNQTVQTFKQVELNKYVRLTQGKPEPEYLDVSSEQF